MLLHIIRKELFDHFLSLRFAIACGVCLVALLLSSLVLARNYGEGMSVYHMNAVMHRNEVLQRTRVFDLWQGVTVDRPLNVMNVLVRGITSELTESIKVQMGNRLDFPESYEQNPLIPLFLTVDFVFVVGIIMSLLALAFSYDAVSGEKENGVLKLMMSYSVPRDLVLLGKWIGGYLALIVPFFLAFLVALIVMALFPEVAVDVDSVLATIALLCVALLYLAVIYSLGLFVSCRTEWASTSITVLLLVWVVFILAIPSMAPYITSQLVPAPSRESVDREKMELGREQSRMWQTMMEEEQKRTGKDRGELYGDEAFQEKMKSLQEEWKAEGQKIEDSYMGKLQTQTRWSGIVARISPLTSFNLAAFDLASAGIEQEKRFVDALKSYSSIWEEYSKEKRTEFDKYMEEQRKNSKDGRIMFMPGDMERFNNLDLSDYPRFHFELMSLKERLAQIYVDLLLLGVWTVLFFMLAYLSFLRYDVQ